MKNPRLSLIIGIVSISIFPILVKWVPVSGMTSAFYRMAIATAVIIPVVLWKKSLQKPSLKVMGVIALCGLLFGSDIAVWNIAIQQSSAIQASLLTNLAPVWVGLGTFFFLPNKPNSNFWIGMVFALSGMVILMGVDVFINLSFDLGFLFGILSSIFYASYLLISKTVLDKINTISFMTYSMLVSTVYLGIACFFMDEPFSGFTTPVWGILIAQGLICQLLGWFSLNYAVQKLGANKVSLSLLSQALVTAILAWFLLNEEITMQMLLGGAIILIGIGITFQKKTLFPKRTPALKPDMSKLPNFNKE
ncbi:DMT family transporter [Flavobacterium sp. '19STA2R22 D10 B1']|uniref:DMT family transporter n=1 Tax=Flavobacterium aerium TaxID=3037261 RepID=UPI00278C8F0F|nr:DMT family transporter [Flavobacterium sp. '19STA2R22 D10 B1']